MAIQNLQANPIVITGSMATSYKTQLAAAAPNAGKNNTSYGTLTSILIEKIYWANPAVAAQSITIGDPISGLTIAYLQCEVAGSAILLDWQSNPKLVQDFEINSFPSGVLYIYLR
jgi:hypothetical protein